LRENNMADIFKDFPECKKVLANISFARFGYVDGVFGFHLEFTNKLTGIVYDCQERLRVDSVFDLALTRNEIAATVDMYATSLKQVNGLEAEDLLDIPVCLALNEDDVVCDWCILTEIL